MVALQGHDSLLYHSCNNMQALACLYLREQGHEF